MGCVLFDDSLLDNYACVPVSHLEPGGLCCVLLDFDSELVEPG